MSRIGDKIKEVRLKKGLSPKQLGKKCGVTESFILEIETGRKVINEKLLAQLSKALGVSLEDGFILEPSKEEQDAGTSVANKAVKPVEIKPEKREIVEPLNQWESAFSNIIKKIPIYDEEMRKMLGYRYFPIIDKKVEGFHPDKLIYVEAVDNQLRDLRIHKGDKVLVYLNSEFQNNTILLVEWEGKRLLRKVKKLEGNRVQLITSDKEQTPIVKDMKEIKVLGKCIRVEVTL